MSCSVHKMRLIVLSHCCLIWLILWFHPLIPSVCQLTEQFMSWIITQSLVSRHGLVFWENWAENSQYCLNAQSDGPTLSTVKSLAVSSLCLVYSMLTSDLYLTLTRLRSIFPKILNNYLKSSFFGFFKSSCDFILSRSFWYEQCGSVMI